MSTVTRGEPLDDLSGFQRDLLAAVADAGKASGLHIKGNLENAYEIREINHGRLYPNLDTLVDKGLVEKGVQDQRTNYYALTDRGRRQLGAHVNWHTKMLEETND